MNTKQQPHKRVVEEHEVGEHEVAAPETIIVKDRLQYGSRFQGFIALFAPGG